MAEHPTPDDIARGLDARCEHTEGRRLTPLELHDSCVALADITITMARAQGEPEHAIVEAVRVLAVTAARAAAQITDPAEQVDTEGCDCCSKVYATAVIEAADSILPAGQTQRDANGDPDVHACPFCVYEHENDPDRFSDVTSEERVRWAEEDEALVAGDPT